MSKTNKILNTLSATLPNDRPITAVQVVESIEKCPPGFYPISRTYDQDQDADLWREGSFLKKKLRYLCLSKTEGLPNFVVQEIVIVNEKSVPPEGYSILQRTADTEQRAWRKKQLCYRLVNRSSTSQAVTDIIICSRFRKAPDGFILAGEINGVIVCYKMGNVQDSEMQSPDGSGSPAQVRPPERPRKPSGTAVSYPKLNDGDHDYEILNPGYVPSRPAPHPPVVHQHSTHSLNTSFNGLEGVPFVLNPKVTGSTNSDWFQFPIVKARTMQQLMRDYDYPFTVERQT